jgi:hypothetical protein
MSIDELKKWISRSFWTAEQVAGWVSSHFIRKAQYENEVVKLTGDQTITGDITIDGKLGAGGAPSAQLQANSAISTAYAGIAMSSTDSILSLANNLLSEAANLIAFLHFNVNGGTYNRVGGIGLVSESASDRKASLVFVTDNGSGDRTEKMRITGDGYVGIGVTPSAALHVAGPSAVTPAILLNNVRYMGALNSSGNASRLIGMDGSNNAFVGGIDAAQSGTVYIRRSGANRIVITGTGVGIGTDLPSSELDVVGTIEATGINLGEDTLTVYDEGTWSPAITGSGSNPTVTYTSQLGRYTRIGDVVHYRVNITINTISGGSGDVRISLPITAQGNDSAPALVHNVDMPGTPVSVVASTRAANANFAIYSIQDNGAISALQVSGLAAGDIIGVSGNYFV